MTHKIPTKKCSKRIHAQVESVVAFSEEEQEAFVQKLKQVFQTEKVQIKFALNPKILGGVRIKINSELLDASVLGELQQFKHQLEQDQTRLKTKGKVAPFLTEKINVFNPKPTLNEVGIVLSVSDGVAAVAGLNHLMSGEVVAFETGAKGMALNLNAETTDIIIFEKAETLREGMHAFATGQMNRIPVGLNLLGRVLNPLGKALDDKESLSQSETRPLFAPAPGIIERDKVKTPVHTGIKAIDSLVPIGRGQRELIIGDRQTGKTTLILDTILSQKKQNEKAASLKDKLFCIYVAVGQKQSTIRHILNVLEEKGALDYTIIVSASASDSAVLQYLAPYAGCAIGEYFRDQGMNAIIFYDDLSKHAVAYREMSLLLKRPSGREAYPGDVFYLHSRLLERAAQLSPKEGSGSLTAIPVIETQEGDVSAYIPTNVISITDGQIFLESQLFHQGVRPAINVGLSVSRVGSAAQSKAMKKVSASLKLDLSQYREVLNFAQLSSDLDPATQHLLTRGSRLTEVMKQPPFSPLTLADEIISLFIGSNGFLDDVAIEEAGKTVAAILDKIKVEKNALMSELEKGIMSDQTAEELKVAIIDFFKEKEQI